MHGVRGRDCRFHRKAKSHSASGGRAVVRRPSRRSGVAGDRAAASESLLDAVRDDPEGQLGAAARGRFGDTLPFLMKVLAADEPLSLQAHPSAEQAAEGFAREDRWAFRCPRRCATTATAATNPNCWWRWTPSRRWPDSGPRAKAVELMRALAVSDLDPFVPPAVRPVRRRRPARAVHHLDHRAATGPRRAGARRDRRRDPLYPFGRESSSRRKPRRCSSWASAIPVTPVCWPPCC